MLKLLLLGCCVFLSGCFNSSKQQYLTSQQSFFLKRNASSPVKWQAWNKQTLDQIKKSNKLTVINIGYFTCGACVQMDQVFDDSSVAAELNQNFINIKVDREELPDVDSHFLNLQTMIMGFGGWPLTMIVTPDFKPVFALTFTKKPELLGILKKVAKTWKQNPQTIHSQVDQFLERIQPVPASLNDFDKDQSLIKDYYAYYTHRFDSFYGGKSINRSFNTKFPQGDEMRLLLRYFMHTGEKQAKKMVSKTMVSISQSSLFDHLEGGIHRYSVSRNWNTPNSEKTILDQAAYLNILMDLIRISDKALYRENVEKTVRFVINTMSGVFGGFSASTTALDSEGNLLNTWIRSDLAKLLNKTELTTFNRYYSITPPSSRLARRGVIKRNNTSTSPDTQAVERKLLESRNSRGSWQKDPQVVTASSAYMISSLAKFARLWPSQDFLEILTKHLNYLLNQHRNLKGDLFRRSIKGHTEFPAQLQDYAFLIDALLETYQTTFDTGYLTEATNLQKQQDRLFYNQSTYIYRDNIPHGPIPEQTQFKDQTVPSGLSMSFWNLIRLARYQDNIAWKNRALQILDYYPDTLKTDPISFAHLLLALDFNISNPKHLVIIGDPKKCQETSANVFKKYFPYLLLSCYGDGKEAKLHSRIGNAKGNSFYICDDDQCSEAIESLETVKQQLYSN